MPSLAARSAAPAAGLLLLAVLLGLHFYGYQSHYQGLLAAHGIPPFRFPFLDTDANLSAWECARRGFDVIALNPCDALGRPYNYAPFWMTIAFIPLGTEDRVATGLILDVAFLLSLALLAPLQRIQDVSLLVAASWSTATLFALDRGNTDLLLYLLLFVATWLLAKSMRARWAGYGVIWLMAAIKYYPAVLLLFAAREPPRMFRAVMAVSAFLAVIFVALYRTDALRAMAFVPEGPPDVLLFGAKNLPLFLGRGALWLAQPWDSAAALSVLVALLAQMVLTIVCLRMAFRLARNGAFRAALASLPERSTLPLVGGCALLVGCFFATQNIAYRGIFFFPVLHGLLLAATNADDRLTPRYCRRAAILIVALMWADGIRTAILALPWPAGWEIVPHDIVILLREAAWWWIVAVMGGVLLDFIMRTEFGAALARRTGTGQPNET